MCRHIHSIHRHKTKHRKKADLHIWVDLIKANSPLGCLKVKTHQWQTNKWHSGVFAEVVVTVKKVLNCMICQMHFLEGPEELLSPVERQWHRCAQQHQNRHDTLALHPSHRVHGVLVPGWFHDVKSAVQTWQLSFRVRACWWKADVLSHRATSTCRLWQHFKWRSKLGGD